MLRNSALQRVANLFAFLGLTFEIVGTCLGAIHSIRLQGQTKQKSRWHQRVILFRADLNAIFKWYTRKLLDERRRAEELRNKNSRNRQEPDERQNTKDEEGSEGSRVKQESVLDESRNADEFRGEEVSRVEQGSLLDERQNAEDFREEGSLDESRNAGDSRGEGGSQVKQEPVVDERQKTVGFRDGESVEANLKQGEDSDNGSLLADEIQRPKEETLEMSTLQVSGDPMSMLHTKGMGHEASMLKVRGTINIGQAAFHMHNNMNSQITDQPDMEDRGERLTRVTTFLQDVRNRRHPLGSSQLQMIGKILRELSVSSASSTPSLSALDHANVLSRQDTITFPHVVRPMFTFGNIPIISMAVGAVFLMMSTIFLAAGSELRSEVWISCTGVLLFVIVLSLLPFRYAFRFTFPGVALIE